MWYKPTGKEKRHQSQQNRTNSSHREARGRPRGSPCPSKEFCDTLYIGGEAKKFIDTWQPDLVYTSDDMVQELVAKYYVNSKTDSVG
jgi:hypothetical protein